jgi:altronate hydrolase
VLITEVPEFCGAEHLLANRAKDVETGRAVYRMVDWYKEYASKFGAVLNNNPSPGNIAGGLLNITIKSLGAVAKAGTTRVEGVVEYAETPKNRGVNLMQGPVTIRSQLRGLLLLEQLWSSLQLDAELRLVMRLRR